MKRLFDFTYLRGDIFGGITAGIVALPLALAFGVSSGLGPMAGLYGAIFIGFFAALFGGTNTQISGPTAPMTAVSMLIVAGIVAASNGDVERALPAILAVFLLAGLIQIGMGVLGFGKYIRYIPYPVVSGFMTAIGVIIILTQILPAVGYYPKEDADFVSKFKPEAEEIILRNILNEEAKEGLLVLESFEETIDRAGIITEEEILQESKTLAGKEASGVIGAVRLLPRAIQNISWIEFLLALGTIVIIYGFKRITKVVPSTLVALIVMSGIADLSGIDYRVIEKIPGGIPMPNFELFTTFKFSILGPYIFSALTLAILGSIDSLLTSVVADNMTRTKHNPNKELVGQGIGNSIAAVFGGIPGAGATIRTVVNINAGGKTRLSGMIAGILLLLTLLLLGPVASRIPAAVLAGILITVGVSVMDYKGLKAIPNMPRPEVVIMIVVMLLSAFWNLVYAVGIGLVIASLMFMKKIGDLTAASSRIRTLKDSVWQDEIDFPEELKGEVYIKHVDGPLFFGSTSNFEALSKQIPANAKAVIIRMSRVPYMDQSGLYAMEDVLIDLINQGKKVIIVGLQKQPRYMMERVDIIPNLISKDQLSTGFKDCILSLKESLQQESLAKADQFSSVITGMNAITAQILQQMTPQEALDRLVEGNSRFVAGKLARPNLAAQVTETAQGQYPFAVVLSCIDSRTPAEHIFNLGIGDIFSARIAGNIVNDDILGSMEYACKVVGSKLILVLGHTSCGAVTSACNNVELGNITTLLSKIRPAVGAFKDPASRVDEVAAYNVKLSMENIRKDSSILGEMEAKGEIMIKGAMYDVATGQVTLLD